MRSKLIKRCFVPMCENTSHKTPNKVFVYVPKDTNRRKAWLLASRRERKHGKLSPNSPLYCCEDHFHMEEDMENYMRYKMMNRTVKLMSKIDTVPHIFDCQRQGKKPEKLVEEVFTDSPGEDSEDVGLKAADPLSLEKQQLEHFEVDTPSSAEFFRCSVCSLQFLHEKTLKKHIKYVCFEGKVQHLEKGEFLPTKSARSEHQCSICDKVCHDGNRLKLHMIAHSFEKNLQCRLCKKTFSLSFDLLIERLEYNYKNILKCNSCTRELFTQDDRRIMTQSQMKSESTVCDNRLKISLKATSDSTLKHSKETKLVECYMSQKRIRSRKGRKKRLPVQEMKEESGSTQCEEAIRFPSTFNQHCLTFRDGFECGTDLECAQILTGLKGSLEIELSDTMHLPVQGMKEESGSTECEEAIRFPSTFNKHCLTFHGDFECGTNLECAQILTGLKRSLEMESSDTKLRRNVCDVRITRKTVINNHMLTGGREKLNKCKEGGKGFVCDNGLLPLVKPHVKKEELEPQDKKLECNVCWETFHFKSVLANHMLVHENFEEHNAVPDSNLFPTEFVLGL